MIMDIYEIADKISNQEEFHSFMKALIKDLENNPTEWENNNLKSFLNGIEGYCFDKQYVELKWSTIAEILLAAKVYE
jgi:predicted transcriptional regulator